MSITDERLRHLANTKRGMDDPKDVGYYEACALARECLDLRARVAELEGENAALQVNAANLEIVRGQRDALQAENAALVRLEKSVRENHAPGECVAWCSYRDDLLAIDAARAPKEQSASRGEG